MPHHNESTVSAFLKGNLNRRTIPWLTLAISVSLIFSANSASAQTKLAPNQTHGFGNGGLVTFTYLQNFDCVDQPALDLDFNGIKAESDPAEMQTPICQPLTEPTADPAGGDIKHTAHLYVLIPMFSIDHDTNPADAMACQAEAGRENSAVPRWETP